jgi:hypothetical protein
MSLYGGIMRKFTSLSLIFLLLISPIVAKADTASDIAAYNAAFDKGDNEQALKLLKIALDNAKSLPPDDPKLAMIAYENAYYYAVFEDYNTAYSAIKIVDNAFKLKPELQNGSDIDEYKFISALIKFIADVKSNSNKKNVQILDNATEKIKNKERQDDLFYKSNMMLNYYYLKTFDWENLAKGSQRQIDALEKTQDETLNNYRILAYLNRGQVKFVREVRGGIYVTTGTHINGKNHSGWEDALTDIALAEKYYGKPKSINDASAAGLDGWYGMIRTYAITYRKSDKIHDTIKNINKSVGLTEDGFFSNIERKECDKIFDDDIGRRISYGSFMAARNSFGYARAVFDIDGQNTIRNVRILSSFPNEGFGQNVVSGIQGTKITKLKPGTPKECLTDHLLSVQFVTD